MNQTNQIYDELKLLLKAAGLTYGDVARHLPRDLAVKVVAPAKTSRGAMYQVAPEIDESTVDGTQQTVA